MHRKFCQKVSVNGDMVKHELRVASYELRVEYLKARVQSLKVRVKIQKCECRV